MARSSSTMSILSMYCRRGISYEVVRWLDIPMNRELAIWDFPTNLFRFYPLTQKIHLSYNFVKICINIAVRSKVPQREAAQLVIGIPVV